MFVSLFAKQKSPLLQILYYQFIRLLKIHAPQKFRCFLVKMPPLIKHWLNRQSLSQTKIIIILPYRILYVLPDSQNDITRKRPGSRCPSKEINRPWRTFFVSDNNNTATRVIYFHSKFYRNRLLRHVLIRIIHRNLKI